nr:MAG TPA: hypothetical protein [Caudoviricetes sp.]
MPVICLLTYSTSHCCCQNRLAPCISITRNRTPPHLYAFMAYINILICLNINKIEN